MFPGKFVFSATVDPSVDSFQNKSQLTTVLHFHAQYWFLGPFLFGHFGRAAGSFRLDNEIASSALSSEENSNTSGMRAVA
jgi:hypothetical protein